MCTHINKEFLFFFNIKVSTVEPCLHKLLGTGSKRKFELNNFVCIIGTLKGLLWVFVLSKMSC